MGSAHIHGSWSDSAHNAETPINSLRKLSGSILISCLMRKVCHALWKILGKPYWFLKSHLHSLLFWLCCEELSATVQKWMKGRQSDASVSWLESMAASLQQEISMQETLQHLGSVDWGKAPRDTRTAGLMNLHWKLHVGILFFFFVKQRKRENGWKWVVKDEESRKITLISLLRLSMGKGTHVLHKLLYLKAYFFAVNLLPSDQYKIGLLSLISAGWNSLLSEVMWM